MCLAAGRIFGRRFGIRQRPRTSAPSTEYGGLLGLPFAKHYREPCRVVAARRKEASRTVACRPFVTFCLRSRLPFLGRRGPPEGPSRGYFLLEVTAPSISDSEVAAPGCCSSMGTHTSTATATSMDGRWDGVLPLLMPLPSTRLLNLITPLPLTWPSQAGTSSRLQQVRDQPPSLSPTLPLPLPSSLGSRVK